MEKMKETLHNRLLRNITVIKAKKINALVYSSKLKE